MLAVPVPDLAPSHGLAARPDVLWFAISAFVEGIGATRAVPVLREATAVLVRHVLAVAPSATLEARRLRTGGGSGDKSSKQDRSDVELGGVVRVPLASSLDFWARAELVAHASDAIAAAAADLARHKPAVRLGWREPIARVADEEPHRARLIERQATLLRALAAPSKEGPASLVGADASAEVVQLPISLDEVRLHLAWRRHGA